MCLYCAYGFKKYELSQSLKILIISLLGMIFGAKAFGILSGIYRDIGIGESISIDSLVDTGIVFYGGLFGLLAVYGLCLKTKYSILDQQREL